MLKHLVLLSFILLLFSTTAKVNCSYNQSKPEFPTIDQVIKKGKYKQLYNLLKKEIVEDYGSTKEWPKPIFKRAYSELKFKTSGYPFIYKKLENLNPDDLNKLFQDFKGLSTKEIINYHDSNYDNVYIAIQDHINWTCMDINKTLSD